MRNAHDTRVRDALWRLTASDASRATVPDTAPPFFLRAPSIALLWTLTLLALVGLLALSRVRVPRVVRGAVVAVRTESHDVTLLLLVPPSARPYVKPGQHAQLATGDAQPLTLDVAAVESGLLDAAGARRRYPLQPSVLAQVEDPRLVVRLTPCARPGCLTPSVGDTYRATASAGTRSLASYATSGS
jgi:hypothetical protein